MLSFHPSRAGKLLEQEDTHYVTSWLGYVHIDGKTKTVVGRSPYVNSISNNEFVQLPADPENLNDFFCEMLNRTGIMCGSCIKNYGPSVTSFACVSCPDGVERYSWLLYLVAVFLPNTVFFVCVFIFSMTATFGPLNAFIFFAQVITTVAMVNAEGTLVLFDSVISNDATSLEVMNVFHDFYTVVYDMWNLNFFLPWIPPFCLSSTNTLIQVPLLAARTIVSPTIFQPLYLSPSLLPYARCLMVFL